jgi:hypothetical protein
VKGDDMTDTAEKINAAIHECLERCYAADYPIACLAVYIKGLKQDPQWRLAEVDLVETRVRQILTLLVKPSATDRLTI